MIEHHYASVNSIRMHFASSGKGELILFLHGFPEYWAMWEKQLDEFGKDHMAVAPDMRGYNLTSAPQDIRSYKQKILMEDIRQLVEYFGYKKFTLVAHDWGGSIAWTFAMFMPEYLDRLIIINAPHPTTFERELRNNPEQRKASSYMLMFRDPLSERTLSRNNFERLIDFAFGDIIKRGLLTTVDVDSYISAWSQPGALTGGLNYYRATYVDALEDYKEAIKKSAFGESLPKILVPTLVIWGEKDTALLTGCIEGLEKYVSNITIKRVPDASHWIVREKPTLINKLIREFLDAS